MIGIFEPDDVTRIAHTYNSLTLNNPTDDPDNTYSLDTAQVTDTPSSVMDANPNDDGMEAFRSLKVNKVITETGMIRATSLGLLYDKIEALGKAFDPAKVSHENPLTFGFLPYVFATPTADLTTYPTGLIECYYNVRARTGFSPLVSNFQGYTCGFQLQLLAIDPRRYLNSTNTQSGTGTIANSKADYRSFPTITLTMSGAGSATFALINTPAVLGTAQTLTLDLSGMANNDSVVIDMQKHSIKKNGSDAASIYVSGTWWPIEPGNNVITDSNTTAVSAISIAHNPAFCI